MSEPATGSGQASSRERLLDAAEELFAEVGFNGASVRQIVERASVNLGAIPYHFGTKENLFKEVMLRRARPLRAERQRMLEALFAADPEPALEDLLYAMLEPAFRTSRENEAFRRLLGRASMDPTPEVRRLMIEIYTLDFMVVPRALREHFAAMDETEFHWKLNCLYGVMLFVQADTGKIQTIAGEGFDTSQPAVALKYVIPFLAAGFQAPVKE
ncbi:TetR/AcrR family transcriptional regulator [Faunimonas sp. B44]|uniref:TetR/AcrR family transcriptional regulator n=1 Tax=Faunimonas sp. B44 TaxID=3461493 RepID=UPI004044EABE